MFGFKSFKKQSSSFFARHSSYSHIRSKQFTKRQFEIASLWWAQFLPGVKNVSFEEINQFSNLENVQIMSELHSFHKAHEKPITKQQLMAFIQILSRKMDSLSLENHGGDLSYLQIGHESSYEPPEIVEAAVEEARIRASSFGLFPYKTAMKIYNNGQIQIDDKVYCTNPEIKYYGINTNFDNAPLVTISGDKFKAIEIHVDSLSGQLLTGFVNRLRKFEIKDLRSWNEDIDTSIPYLYTSISLSDFKGSEQDFLQFSNEQWIDILQCETAIHKHFQESMYIYYRKTKEELMNTTYFSIGSVRAEKIEDDYYQYTTGPVRALSASHKGTVGTCGSLSIISPDDLIFKTKIYGEVAIAYLRSSNKLFKVHLCDINGKQLQEVETSNPLFVPTSASKPGLFAQKPALLTQSESNSWDTQNKF